ncbi:MAG: YhcH/YjgK/YiaL family protein [Ignavibacteriales bacterium]|nr:YhcH/YjgK/YiaL family protein [Ignavibacteriales bacterium]
MNTKPNQNLEGKLEAHRKYIDVQYVIRGEELMGYAPLGGQKILEPYKEENDIVFFTQEINHSQKFLPECLQYSSRKMFICRELRLDKSSAVKKLVIKVRTNLIQSSTNN